MRLIEGQITDVADEPDEAEIFRLRDKIRMLESSLAVARMETERAKRESSSAVGSLRKQLSPLYRALQQIFGELDAVGVDETAQEMPNSRMTQVWASWKQRLGEGPAKIIDALLLHGDMNTQQLAIATGYHRTSIPALIFKLNKAGLLNKNGGRFSLKQL